MCVCVCVVCCGQWSRGIPPVRPDNSELIDSFHEYPRSEWTTRPRPPPKIQQQNKNIFPKKEKKSNNKKRHKIKNNNDNK